jgi:hypothetical protein
VFFLGIEIIHHGNGKEIGTGSKFPFRDKIDDAPVDGTDIHLSVIAGTGNHTTGIQEMNLHRPALGIHEAAKFLIAEQSLQKIIPVDGGRHRKGIDIPVFLALLDMLRDILRDVSGMKGTFGLNGCGTIGRLILEGEDGGRILRNATHIAHQGHRIVQARDLILQLPFLVCKILKLFSVEIIEIVDIRGIHAVPDIREGTVHGTETVDEIEGGDL